MKDMKEIDLRVGSGKDTCIEIKRIPITTLDYIRMDRAAFIRMIGEQMAAAVLNAEATR